MPDSISFADIVLGDLIGTGNFGQVFKGDYLGTEVAIKKFILLKEWDAKKYIDREISILKETRHPNVVQFMGTCQSEENLFVITEFVPNGNLKQFLAKNNSETLGSRLRLSFSIDTARALAYLHAHNIIHRDLKGENLLLTENLRIKVCDFGFSRLEAVNAEEKKRLSYCGTDAYMAPEIILCTEFDHRIDIFSYGIIICEIVACKPAEALQFPREMPGFGIPEEEVRKLEETSPNMLLDVAVACTRSDPDKRPNLRDIMKILRDMELESHPNEHAGLITQIVNSSEEEDDSNVPLSSTTPDIPGSGSIPNIVEIGKTTRIGHRIPHRFTVVNNINTLTKCRQCHKRIGIGKSLRCDDCGFQCHKGCGLVTPNSCGLSPEMFEASLAIQNI